MDPILSSNLSRARNAIAAAFDYTDTRTKAQAFIDGAFAILQAGTKGQTGAALAAHANPVLRDAVSKAGAATIGDFGGFGGTAELAAAYVASVAEHSLVERIKKFARVLPLHGSGRPLVATGFTADAPTEGAPKTARTQGVTLADEASAKPAAIVVMSGELVRAGGDAVRRLFEDELRRAVVRGSNAATLAMLTDSSTIAIGSTGDALADLRAGLAAAGPSEGYVVAAETGIVADLATREANRGGMGVRGGTFIEGVEVVAVDGFSGLQVIPASRVAMRDYGLTVTSAEHADVDMSETPDSPAQTVSLFQTNSVGLLGEWPITIAGDAPTVHVAQES